MADYRNKRVKLKTLDLTLCGEPHTEMDEKHLGEIGVASSIYNDGRASHDEGYMVKFADGYEGTYVAHELEPVE
jgi:hypothetical protein